MPSNTKEVVITGIGLVTCYGEGADVHWDLLGGETAPKPLVDLSIVPPYGVHALPEMDWAEQIPRKDQRQMENWQRLGTYAAGMALDDAGLKENPDLLSEMDLVVAAGGGERDVETDESIIRDAMSNNDREQVLLERLPSDLRPTLFLAQLSNLLAGNISIVHKVTGSSRTYMGEETAGVTVIDNAMKRIASGQSTHMLVGGSYNADRPDAVLPHVLGHFLYDGENEGIRARQANGGGMRLGSVGAFLVLEEAEHAKARGVVPYAKLDGVTTALVNREDTNRIEQLANELSQNGMMATDAILSGAGGAAEATKFEIDFFENHNKSDVPVRFYQSLTGQPLEANFPLGIALACLALKSNGFYPPFEAGDIPASRAVENILVTCFGHVCGEGFAKLGTI